MTSVRESVGLVFNLVAVAITASADPTIEIEDTYLTKSDLRVLVETARMYQPALSHSHKVDSVRGWLIVIDTTKSGPLADHSRVIGPLWSIDQQQSAISFLDGVHFTAADVAAGKAKPPTGFDDKGELIREVTDAATGRMVVEQLDLTASPARWVRTSDAAPVGPVGDDWIEGRVSSQGGRMLVQQEQDGSVHAYDLFSGLPRQDEWLCNALADRRARPDMGNSRAWLTDDLQFLLVQPADGWNDNGRIITEFTLEGRSYSRAEYGLLYHRPDPQPTALKRPPSDAMFLVKPPHGAFVVDGGLLLLEVGESSLRLYTPDGITKFEWTKHELLNWPVAGTPFRQFDAASDRLVFRNLAKMRDIDLTFRTVDLVIWNYRAGSLERQKWGIGDLFDTGATYAPMHGEAPIDASP